MSKAKSILKLHAVGIQDLEFLVEQGIDSISITPDSVIKTIKAISAIEKKLASSQNRVLSK